MIRIMATSDWHVDEHNRFAETIEILDWFVGEAAYHKPDMITIGGDSAPVSVRPMTPLERNTLAEYYQRLAAHAPVFVIAGNHDAHLGDVEIFNRLRVDVHPIRVFSKPAVVGCGNAVVALLPWPNKGGLLAKAKADGLKLDDVNEACRQAMRAILMGLKYEMDRQANPNDVRILLGHMNVTGADVGGFTLVGQDVECGSADLEATGADVVLLGHIHKRQSFGSRVHFSGSIRRVDFGEEEEIKGYLLVEAYSGDDPEVEFYQSPLRKMHTVHVNSSTTDANGLACWLRDILPVAEITNADLRIIIDVDEEKRGLVDEALILKEFHADLAHSYKVEYRVTPTTRIRVPEMREAISDADRVRTYLKNLDPQPTGETIERLLVKMESLTAVV